MREARQKAGPLFPLATALCYDAQQIRREAALRPDWGSRASMAEAPKQSTARRRSLRIVMRIPLIVNTSDASAEWEPVETVVISLHGGMIRTRQQFGVGATLDIRMRLKDRSTRGRVVWSKMNGDGKGFEVGFEILEPPGFWEVNFPPDRWSQGARPETAKS
jgi:hypothetical protein